MTAFPRVQIPVPVADLLTTSASLRLGHLLHVHLRRNRIVPLLCSSVQEFCNSKHRLGIKILCHERALMSKRDMFLKALFGVFSATNKSCLCVFGGSGSETGDKGKIKSKILSRNSFNGRLWTNLLLAINVLVFSAQIATRGKMTMWGAKINSLIDQGQLWRLLTSSFLHGNVGHLLVNCYSLNSIGPGVENFSGPRRFLAVYITSIIASSTMSYYFCKSPSVGASGAIFGLVGSTAVFVWRHRNLTGGGTEDLRHIANVVALNMLVGVLFKGIDNWGHMGGLLGGAAMSWFLGPAWTYHSKSVVGKAIYIDKAPIFYLFDRIRGAR
ncbi:RHOMBOID-like protein 10, chloroplastic [Aristolochia californica]|uniref:RHOMBOID-like protein 10, chloroplastic n=1 Tax=Aristolochia californica TaxID=171875 RepID=UPI0035DC4BA2